MDRKTLHTTLLEQLFGPIQLSILKQENDLRIVHLLDAQQISRTMAIVRFRNYANPTIKDSHASIVGGSLLGITLLDAEISFKKSAVASINIALPDWLEKDFRTTQSTTLALYSHINILDRERKEYFIYAELFEIIPPEIIALIPGTKNTSDHPDKEMISLLNYAEITPASIDTDK